MEQKQREFWKYLIGLDFVASQRGIKILFYYFVMVMEF